MAPGRGNCHEAIQLVEETEAQRGKAGHTARSAGESKGSSLG